MNDIQRFAINQSHIAPELSLSMTNYYSIEPFASALSPIALHWHLLIINHPSLSSFWHGAEGKSIGCERYALDLSLDDSHVASPNNLDLWRERLRSKMYVGVQTSAGRSRAPSLCPNLAAARPPPVRRTNITFPCITIMKVDNTPSA
jgi:hypothetical protein